MDVKQRMIESIMAIEGDYRDFEASCDPARLNTEPFYQSVVKGVKRLCESWYFQKKKSIKN